MITENTTETLTHTPTKTKHALKNPRFQRAKTRKLETGKMNRPDVCTYSIIHNQNASPYFCYPPHRLHRCQWHQENFRCVQFVLHKNGVMVSRMEATSGSESNPPVVFSGLYMHDMLTHPPCFPLSVLLLRFDP